MSFRLVSQDGDQVYELRRGSPLTVGRALTSDVPLLDEILAALPQREHRISTVLEMIVRSPQFREIRGLAHPPEA